MGTKKHFAAFQLPPVIKMPVLGYFISAGWGCCWMAMPSTSIGLPKLTGKPRELVMPTKCFLDRINSLKALHPFNRRFV